MTKQKQELKELVDLLKQAAQEMINKGPLSTLTEYDTCENLGVYLNETVTKLEQEKEIDVFELWGIFAPTSVWDDSGGSEELANKIFELIKKCFGDILV
ncbi:MAG: hypothetical protein E3J70_10610 [Candidatus Heimdallarchaeota archaeon]|nr:MAG: hypothetical protein E3J70_10610 [Candidatus Heimdallarchaeota archaeon]